MSERQQAPELASKYCLNLKVAKAIAAAAAAEAEAIRNNWKVSIAMAAVDNNTPLQGAVPIVYRGEIVGAIGVSGVLPAQDEQVAGAGVLASL